MLATGNSSCVVSQKFGGRIGDVIGPVIIFLLSGVITMRNLVAVCVGVCRRSQNFGGAGARPLGWQLA